MLSLLSVQYHYHHVHFVVVVHIVYLLTVLFINSKQTNRNKKSQNSSQIKLDQDNHQTKTTIKNKALKAIQQNIVQKLQTSTS